ncbi:MAG TPA: hypothetical protein VIE63_14795 [Ramlibacter sp.]
MKIRPLCFLALGLAWLLSAAPAFANGSCTITSVTLAQQTYTNVAINVTGTVNYTCTRTSNAVDGSPITFSVTADQGMNYSGGTRQVANSGTYFAYALRVGVATWGDGVTAGIGNAHNVSVTFTAAQTSKSGSFNFSLRVAAGLNPPTRPGAYVDTFAVDGTCTTRNGTACSVIGNTGLVSILVPSTCSISTLPGTITMAYTAFRSTTLQANTPFKVTCDNGGTYRMSVSPTGATVRGITYGLKLGTTANSATDVSSTTTYNLTGTGLATQYYANASAASGQAGTCSGAPCTGSTTHTLLVEY